MEMRNENQNKFNQFWKNPPTDDSLSLLIQNCENEQDIDNRSRIIRKLGECNNIQALEYLYKLKRNMDKEDDFIQYEIQLSLQNLINNQQLLNNPELIIADEPTGNLDPETSLEIISLFKKLNSIGTSMIIATHDYNLILKLDGEVYKCEDGSIFEVKRK